MNRVRTLAVTAGIVLLLVAYHEYAYWRNHLHRYGPAKVIALASLAGAALALGLWFLASEVERMGQRMERSMEPPPPHAAYGGSGDLPPGTDDDRSGDSTAANEEVHVEETERSSDLPTDAEPGESKRRD